jgi:hypothetical protein
VAVIHRIGLATQVKITACQPAKRNAFKVERLDQAGAFGLVRAVNSLRAPPPEVLCLTSRRREGRCRSSFGVHAR